MGKFFLARLSDHMQYVAKVRATLDGRDNFAGIDHDACQLGRWLTERRPDRDGLEQEITDLLPELERLHEQFHAISGQALQLRGDRPRAESHVTELFRLSARLVDLLFRLDGLDAAGFSRG